MAQLKRSHKQLAMLLITLLFLGGLLASGSQKASTAPRPPLQVTDLKKEATPGKFVKNDDIISYTISFTMPSDLTGYVAAKIVDVLPATGLSYNNTATNPATLSIGGIISPVTMTPSGNTLYYEFTGADFKNTAGKKIIFELEFKVDGWSSGTIINEAQVYFMPDYPDQPDAADVEEIELAIGPPTEVEELPGDRKTALLWADPKVGVVDYYEIQIDNLGWVQYQLSALTFDPNSGTNGKWYLLFEYLPNNTRLVNNTTYTFQIRAIDPEGYVGLPFTITSTPSPLGDIGGRNTDLVTVFSNNVMPAFGWPDDGIVGTSTSLPHQVFMQLPANFLYAVVHRNFITVGIDATFVMYSDPDFTNEVLFVDRLDNSFNWKSEVVVYVHVTSGNRQLERFYAITITP